MKVSGLSRQVEAFYQWKRNLADGIIRYQNWSRINHLNSDDLELKLQRSIQLLEEDTLTIAFVGEFSRGKTELINALFFSGYGQRMLPSQAGRTTMCPTELFFDTKGGSYLKLLPIETRKEDKSLTDYKRSKDGWTYYPLNISSPQAMCELLTQVARTKSVSFSEARSLGFETASLEEDPDNPRACLVPFWRHALISLDNPVLNQGLRILDTPGLNALGSEPELTVSMIPNAQAVIFLLAADTGVTASDMAIWNEFVPMEKADHQAGRFAVLNKIDMLWDDIQGKEHTDRAIDRVRQQTAKQLQIAPHEVLLASAKQALLARVTDDENLLQKSQLGELENLLSEQILAKKEKLLTQTLVNEVSGMMRASRAIMQSRRQTYHDKLEEIKEKGVSEDFLYTLTEKTQEDYSFYYKKLFTLRSSRRLMKSQAALLGKLVSLEKFEKHADQTRKALMGSWTTLGMAHAISAFFQAIKNDLHNLNNEAKLAQKMVRSIFDRYANDRKSKHLKPINFSITPHIRELEALHERAGKFKRNLSTVMTEQTVVVKRFFTTLVSEARDLYQSIEKETQQWPEEALLPIMQHTIEQKQLLEHQIRRLKELSGSAKNTRSQIAKLQSIMEDIDRQIQEAEFIQCRLRHPAPLLKSHFEVS